MTKCENHKVDDRFMYPRGQPWARKQQIVGRVLLNVKKVGYVRLLYEQIRVPDWLPKWLIFILGLLAFLSV